MSQRHSVRWLDLQLRSEFPHLRSEIYELSPNRHEIFVPREQLDADEFELTFDQARRPVTVDVSLTNGRPGEGMLLEPIPDARIGKDFPGMVLTQSDFEIVVAGTFPALPALLKTARVDGDSLRITFAGPVPFEIEQPLRDFLNARFEGLGFEIAVASDADVASTEPEFIQPRLNDRNILDFRPVRRRPGIPNFVKEEEEWWFENLGALFSGGLSPSSFDFVARADDGIACFLDAATGRSLDLRQAILAYDVVYMELPLEDVGSTAVPSFWETQRVTRSDLLRLIEMDRVRLVRTQPEERSDLGLLREAWEANPRGVVGRRRTAAAMVADIVETESEYLFAKAPLTDHVWQLIERLAADFDVPVLEMSRFLLYPTQIRRGCLGPMMDRGAMAFLAMGQGEALAASIKRVTGKDMRLEAGSFGQDVHIAHALDATYVPFVSEGKLVESWLPHMRVMGDRLNFYRSFNARVSAAWVGNERRRERREKVLPPVPLFSFGDRYGNDVSIDDVLEATARPSDRRKGRALISRLAALPKEERETEAARIAAELSQRTRRRQGVSGQTLLADAGIGVATYALDISLFPFLPMLTIVGRALDVAKRSPVLWRVVDELEQALGERTGRNEDLSFLSSIDRVAMLARPGDRS